MAKDNLGVYIHIPFCSSICSYCDFYSKVQDDNAKVEYLTAVVGYISAQPYGDILVDTLYLGGGTPTDLGGALLAKIIAAAKESFNIVPDAQITVEANPESADYKTLLTLKEAGVNRVSFGVQSSVAKELSALNRTHSAQQAKEAIENARRVGIDHISADLMLGIPYQTPASAVQSLEFITALPVDHLSVYMLSLEPGVPLAQLPLDDITMGEDELADCYLDIAQCLEDKGFMQYEVSNFAKTGGISRHNIKYWLLDDYLGIGPSAHSFIGGKRFEFAPNTGDFIAGSWKNSRINCTPGGDAEEYGMLRLRLSEGLDIDCYKNTYPEIDTYAMGQKAKNFIDQGYLKQNGSRLSLTKKGFLVSNYIISELI